ncbi:hypothetical protein [Sulfitobacter aestuariivivens]|uniref:Uncharacterized protein n=1 Tax=Sulfitobacter aestuariivivens TaxID=2766981 RepID=A0A927HFR6_9RHOB|nr:hypothetical protein [Sulfitobacter aestuariivivens]MBD3666127.1 hypothetical protein [Sulfitobacter aestuariivivens]
MRFSRRTAMLSTLAFYGTAATANTGEYSLSNRARWRSFGVDDWIFRDPFERQSPGAVRQPYSSWSLSSSGGRTAQVLSLIGFAEAGKLQYNAVHMSASRRPRKRPTEMSLGEVFHWIKATPGQQHAIGRYQFIPSTLAMLVNRVDAPPQASFGPRMQDQLAVMLLKDAGYSEFLAGRMTMSKFMDKLAWVWAGLPLRNGQSAYRGIAGNRATISRKFYAEQMQRIFS